MTKFLKDGVSLEELDGGKKAFLDAMKVERSNDDSLANELASGLFVGRTFAFRAEQEKRLEAVTVSDVSKVFTKVLDPKKMVVVQAGDFAKKEEPKRRSRRRRRSDSAGERSRVSRPMVSLAPNMIGRLTPLRSPDSVLFAKNLRRQRLLYRLEQAPTLLFDGRSVAVGHTNHDGECPIPNRAGGVIQRQLVVNQLAYASLVLH